MRGRVTRVIGKVDGRIIKLSDKRSVFLGKSLVRPDANCVEFINKHGDVTRIILSDDALGSLVQLATDELAGDPCSYPVVEEDPEIKWSAYEGQVQGPAND